MCNFFSTALIVWESVVFLITDRALDKSQELQSIPDNPSVSACVPASAVTVRFLCPRPGSVLASEGAIPVEVEVVVAGPMDTLLEEA